jgi:aerobic carbon-monoxide dehydrogenase large subunit
MNISVTRFGSNQGNLRSEDLPLITGAARFTDDINLPGQAYAVFVRAPVGHAHIRRIVLEPARQRDGVLGAFAGSNLLDDGIGSIPPVAGAVGRDGRPMFTAAMPVLAAERIRYAGEPLAVVIAETEAQAQDAAESVVIDYESLPCAADLERALRPGAEAIWPERPDNVALDWAEGDETAVDAAFALAAYIEQVRLLDTRLAPVAMEPRAGIGSWDPETQRYTLIASTQGVAVIRKLLAEGVFKIPASQLRVLTYDVGGGFGMKAQTYPEYGALLYAAR